MTAFLSSRAAASVWLNLLFGLTLIIMFAVRPIRLAYLPGLS